jgi:[acyl-carrier-protein] S-malonyltransferase
MIAWLLAGQGAEHAGMGLELARWFPPAAKLWEQASEAAGTDLIRVTERGGRSLLRTEFLQPALTAVALAAASFLRDEGVEPSMALGHSAGEIGALALAGHASFEQAAHLSATRGRAMAAASRERPGGMAAVHGCEARVEEVLDAGRRAGAIFYAGQTTADTHLVAGEHAALRAAASLARVSLLPVSGAWHSPLMEQAVAELRPVAESIIGDAHGTVAWVSNDTAERASSRAQEVKGLVLSQLVRPMRLHQAVELLLAEGANELVVLGPDHVLRHILHDHLEEHPAIRVHGSSSLEALRAAVKELA